MMNVKTKQIFLFWINVWDLNENVYVFFFLRTLGARDLALENFSLSVRTGSFERSSMALTLTKGTPSLLGRLSARRVLPVPVTIFSCFTVVMIVSSSLSRPPTSLGLRY